MYFLLPYFVSRRLFDVRIVTESEQVVPIEAEANMVQRRFECLSCRITCAFFVCTLSLAELFLREEADYRLTDWSCCKN